MQRIATRMVPILRDLDYCSGLQVLKLPTIANRRDRGDIIEVYKYCQQMCKTGKPAIDISNR